MENQRLVTVSTFGTRDEAEITAAHLGSAGIRAMVVADDEGGLNPGFFADHGVRVVVAPGDEDTAKAILANAAGSVDPTE